MTEQLLAFDYPHDRGAPDMATMVPIKQGDSTTLTTVHFSNGHVVHLKEDELVELKDLLSNWEQPEEILTVVISEADFHNYQPWVFNHELREYALTLKGDLLAQVKLQLES